MSGELLIRWTARFAVACYVGRLYCDVQPKKDEANRRIARWIWTIGCGWFVLHVLAAFQFLHEWSHSAALEHTAKRTLEMTGWNTGSGIYLNYAFLALWLADTILWWRNLDWPREVRVYWFTQTVFAFLMLQATAIFGPRFWIPISVGIVSLLVLTRCRTTRSTE